MCAGNPEGSPLQMELPPASQPQSGPAKHRRRWPWITGAAVLVFIVLAVVFGNKQPAPSAPAIGNTGNVVSATATASATPTSVDVPLTTTVDVPVTTTVDVPVTTALAVVAPPVTKAAPHTTHHATPKPPPAPPVAPPPVAPPPAPVAGKYRQGEFCKTLGATTISSSGHLMTCVEESNTKHWHND
jgi:hypothetical protein